MVGRAHIFNDDLSKEEAQKAREENSKYQWIIVPVDVVPGRKEYKVKVTVLTKEEVEVKQ